MVGWEPMRRQEIEGIPQSTWLTSIDWAGIEGMRYHVVKNQCEDGGQGGIPLSLNCYKQNEESDA